MRIGSRVIKDRIVSYRKDEDNNAYKDLLVTLAKINANQMEGVERFLADTYNPKIGGGFPYITAIEVNLPFTL